MRPSSRGIIEAEKQLLLVALEGEFVRFTLDTVSAIARVLDPFLRDFVRDCLVRHAEDLLRLHLSQDGVFLVDDGANLYELSCAEEVTNHNLLLILLSVRGAERQYALEHCRFSISEAYGQFLSFDLTFPKKVRVKKEEVQDLVTTVFETGYNWFFEKTLEMVRREEDRLGYGLYSFARTVIHSKALLDSVWFASITKGFGFRLLNEAVARESFRLIKPNAAKFKRSTNVLVAELLNTKLPEEQLLMIKAITAKTTIDANLRNAAYNRTDSLYAATLKALYGQNHFTVYPVYESDRACVVALCDTKTKNEIIPILTRHQAELSAICRSSIGGIHGLLESLKARTEGLLGVVWDASIIKPTVFGVGVDIQKLINRLIKREAAEK